DILGAWVNKNLACAHCKRCARRCEVLESPALDIGLIEADFGRVKEMPSEQQGEAVLELVQKRPELYHALRRCCFCGHCTATCATHMTAAARMREWRELFMLAGLMPLDDSKIVMVDNEWHIFSAYRAIYNVAYPEFTPLPDVAEAKAGAEAGAGAAAGSAKAGAVTGVGSIADTQAGAGARAGAIDTLFFPGCSLASYAPELTRCIGHWLDGSGYRWALSTECCGSPLMSAGLFERSKALRLKLLEQIRAAGITRVLTVCPGCGEELGEIMGDEVDIIPLPELLLKHPADKNGTVSNGTLPNANSGPTPHNIASVAGSGAPLDSPAPPSVTFFDSCHDRFDTRHGTAVRKLLAQRLPTTAQVEMAHHGKDTLCCGAGGAVAAYDSELTQRRVWRVLDEARATTATTLVTTCPTCTYTIAQALLSAGDSGNGIEGRNYLELVFEQTIDWARVFGRLEAMWTGEYGPWLTETFF
ncbi:MAG: hypothetical protein LBU31_03260, partial [Coriobacteriales bacterium]|nr:hypothetical protein [Coriobacteriales bacterium]